MQSYFDEDALRRDIEAAVTKALEPHGVDMFHPLAVCAVLEVISSPLKHQISGSPLMQKVGYVGVELYAATHLPRRVEALKSPHSLIVNHLMDAIAAALAKKGPLPKERMFREALKIHLDLSGKPKAEIDRAVSENHSLKAALESALTYLQEGRVIEPCESETHWRLIA